MPKHLAPVLVFVMAVLSACGPTGSVDERFGVIVDGILSAWADADLVCLGENHGGVAFGQLLDAAISYGNVPDTVLFVDEETLDPAFRREISRRDRLQREAGSARHQG